MRKHTEGDFQDASTTVSVCWALSELAYHNTQLELDPRAPDDRVALSCFRVGTVICTTSLAADPRLFSYASAEDSSGLG